MLTSFITMVTEAHHEMIERIVRLIKVLYECIQTYSYTNGMNVFRLNEAQMV